MKKAVCISCTHHYDQRIRAVEAALTAAGYECTYITSDFSHYTKQHYRVELPHCVQVPTRPYTKNISPQRLLSHLRFSRDAMAEAARLKPDLLYVEVPPNSLCRAAARYKKRNPGVKLIFDIFDLWPESFPDSRAKRLLGFPFRIWASFRDRGLPGADLIFTECELFRQKLRRFLKDVPSETLYLCREKATAEKPKPLPAEEALHLCYLGSINNIIDIPTISRLIGHIQPRRDVVLHIIGDGETRDAFIEAVRSTGAQVEFYGNIYDPAAKQAIFDRCSFGLNIMKSSVCVGLTMKSVDYFAGGLPILNTIEADTRDLVARRGIGFNIDRDNLAEAARQIGETTPETQLQMAENALCAFRELFAEEIFQQKLLSHL